MRPGPREGIFFSVYFFVVLSCVLSQAHAQAKVKPKKAAAPAATGSLSGTWRAGATSMDVAVDSWGTDCGPRPQSSRSSGGGVVTVVQTDKQLAIRSRDLEVRSDACWSRNPSMRRVSSSLVDQVWITQCKTAPNDPREEQGTYVLKALGPDTLLYQDVSRYNWALNTSKCIATFTTTQTLARATDARPSEVKVEPAATLPQPTAATQKPVVATPVVEAPERACTPGAAAHITLRPKHADIEVGQRVCFRARVTDAADCVLPSAPVAWSLDHSRALRAELSNGCFNAASTTAEAEGDFKVLANAKGLRAEATVSVRSVDLSALIAKRIEGGALNGFEEAPSLPATPKAAARIATRSVSEPPKDRSMLWIGLGVVAAGLFAGAGAWLMRRKPEDELDAAPRSAAHSAPPRSSSVEASATRASHVSEPRAEPRAAAAPSMRPAAATQMLAPEGRSERPLPSPADLSVRPASANEPWICPLCRLGYPATQGTCPRDGSALMPYAEFSKRSRETAQERQKRCPKCGTLFPADTAFCGTDGAPLVDA